jgi:hypothetical protein
MKTRTAPWDYQQPIATLTQLEDDNIYLEYCTILNRLEREHGIDRIAEVHKTWKGLSNPEKLERVKVLAVELNECTCKPDLPDGRCFPLCPVCKADIDARYGKEIPFEFGG